MKGKVYSLAKWVELVNLKKKKKKTASILEAVCRCTTRLCDNTLLAVGWIP